MLCYAQKHYVPVECAVRPGTSLHHTRRATLLLFLRQSGIVHLPDNLSKELVHHGLAFSRGLNEGAAPLLRQGAAVGPGDLPLGFQVHLIAHQDEGNLLEAFHPDYLVTHRSDVLAGTDETEEW